MTCERVYLPFNSNIITGITLLTRVYFHIIPLAPRNYNRDVFWQIFVTVVLHLGRSKDKILCHPLPSKCVGMFVACAAQEFLLCHTTSALDFWSSSCSVDGFLSHLSACLLSLKGDEEL